MDAHLLVSFVVAVTLLSLTPGPDLMFILANATAGGRRAGVAAALGMSTGLLVHTVAAAFGLGALLAAAPAVLDGVRVVGALFLAYLAVSAWRSSRQPHVQQTVIEGTNRPMTDVSSSGLVENLQPTKSTGKSVLATERYRSTRRVYVLAVLTNLANPKVVVFYLAFLPQFLATGPGHLPATVQLLVLGLVFIGIGFCVDGSAGLVAGTLRDRLVSGTSARMAAVRRWMERVSAAVFGALAVRLVLDTR